MARRTRQVRQPDRSWEVTRHRAARPMAALRPVAWSAVVGAAFAVVVAAPAHADPNAVPDAGSRPAPAGELRLPGQQPSQGFVPPAPVPGPLATQIMAAETEVGLLGEQLKSLNQQLADAQAQTAQAEASWTAATNQVAELRAAASSAAEEAYKSAHELAPYGGLGSDLRDIGKLLPRTAQPPAERQITPWDIARAEENERLASRFYADSLLAEQGLASQQATVSSTFKVKQAALVKLKTDNATQLARIEAEREAFEQSQAGRYGKAGINVDGQAAHPNALRAVQFALAQLGKPYEWGAEGPNRFDCSGLMWAAYRSVGVTLQRVSRDQYRTTTQVSVDKLLPGDLVFFATNRSDWTTIHHVGMYIGDGKMVHSPSTGDVVKISTVWWSRFFGATRVIGAVPAPPVSTPPVSTPPATKPPTSKPPASPSPTPPSSPSPDPTSPSPDPDPTSPSPDPDPTSPSPDPAPASPDPDPTSASPSPAATSTSPSPSATSPSASEPSSTSPTATSSSPSPSESPD